MSRTLDEARYGRTCLLLLKICPFTPRHVINDYYTKHGFASLQDFLEKNKHDLYHLINKRCCCRLFQSRVTPMNRPQWDLLFTKISSSCRTGYTGDCPCQYAAKPGITSDVMDITLCCLLIKNICSRHPGINMSHIETIRTIRNNIVHAQNPKLDILTYNGYWIRVKTLLLDLANHVSSLVHTDTMNMIQELEARVMDAYELGEIRKVIVDQKRISEAEVRISDVERDLDSTNKTIAQNKKEATDHLTNLEGNVKQMAEKVTHLERDMTETTEKVVQVEKSMNEVTGKFDKMEGNIKQTTENIAQVEGNVRQSSEIVARVEGEMRKTTDIVGQLEGNMKQTAQKVAEVETATRQTTEKLTEIEGSMAQAVEELTTLGESFKEVEVSIGPRRGIKRGSSHLDDEIGIEYISIMKQKLIKINDSITKITQLSPLRERGKDELPIEMLFASVVIREDNTYDEKGMPANSQLSGNTDSSPHQGREVKDPSEIFLKDNELVRKIFMLGDAAHGKTTYCSWLLKNWLNVNQREGRGGKELDKWEKIMTHFDFVFLLKFRNVAPHLAYVTDIICENVFGDDIECSAAIRCVLSSDKYRSLIIMDGLDEWNPSEETRRKLVCQGFPNIRISSTVTCFISMRPWVFSIISKIVKLNDRVIEIFGLKENSMKKVIENVLMNHYNLERESPEYFDIYDMIIQHLETKSLNSFMKIPLLAVVCVHI